MKYKPSPFHLAAIYFLYETIRYSLMWAKMGDRIELGALAPFIYFGLFTCTLLVDLGIQYGISIVSKSDWRKVLIVELLILTVIFFFMFPSIIYA